ncbi:MAG: exopolysaccharide Pel transporter PelG [Eubacterium sp.]|nr:exopolysaccharide Pel transporter PelG [Eubacterium sp.]
MAGIGSTLNHLYEKKSITMHAAGFLYSALVTVAPMFLVIGAIILSEWYLNFSDVAYYPRELFADTVLYIFIFSLLSASPFNAVLSKYLSDIIFQEKYEDIMPCFYVGMMLNVLFGSLFAVPFCVREYLVGQVPLYYVFTGYSGFMALLLVFYCMLYLSITKDYVRISVFYAIGMLITFLLSVLFRKFLHFEVTYAILLALVIGFAVIASFEIASVQSYFRRNSRRYRPVFSYFRRYWKLIFINFLYTLGLYIHNFVFWTTDDHMIIAKSFVTMMPYDMATCLAMFTNISATVIFISRVEMRFHDRYKAYSEAVIGGRGRDIRNTQNRMFRCLSGELVSLGRLQFIITVIAFLFCIVVLPQFGFGGQTMRMYHCLAVGYFILFLMYAEILFLYYFTDLTGALLTAVLFCTVTLLGSIWATRLPEIWYGIGLVLGALTGFITAYLRLQWMERNLDTHIFCQGDLIKRAHGRKPSGKVYDRSEKAAGRADQESSAGRTNQEKTAGKADQESSDGRTDRESSAGRTEREKPVGSTDQNKIS